VALFDEGRYFESHDVLEEVWQGLRGPHRPFLQGLIQTAVAFHHAANGNVAGAASVMERAVRNLRPFAPACGGIDVGSLVGELERWQTWLRDPSGPPAGAARPTWPRTHPG
jgi:predicted metal-dependent hydrolase